MELLKNGTLTVIVATIVTSILIVMVDNSNADSIEAKNTVEGTSAGGKNPLLEAEKKPVTREKVVQIPPPPGPFLDNMGSNKLTQTPEEPKPPKLSVSVDNNVVTPKKLKKNMLLSASELNKENPKAPKKVVDISSKPQFNANQPEKPFIPTTPSIASSDGDQTVPKAPERQLNVPKAPKSKPQVTQNQAPSPEIQVKAPILKNKPIWMQQDNSAQQGERAAPVISAGIQAKKPHAPQGLVSQRNAPVFNRPNLTPPIFNNYSLPQQYRYVPMPVIQYYQQMPMYGNRYYPAAPMPNFGMPLAAPQQRGSDVSQPKVTPKKSNN